MKLFPLRGDFNLQASAAPPALEAEECTIEQWRALVLLSDGRGHPMTEN